MKLTSIKFVGLEGERVDEMCNDEWWRWSHKA